MIFSSAKIRETGYSKKITDHGDLWVENKQTVCVFSAEEYGDCSVPNDITTLDIVGVINTFQNVFGTKSVTCRVRYLFDNIYKNSI